MPFRTKSEVFADTGSAVPAIPDFDTNACAGLSAGDRDRLWQAARILVEERGIILRVTTLLGAGVDRAGGTAARLLGDKWRGRLTETVQDVLWKAQDLATLGLDAEGGGQPWQWFHKVLATVAGAASGFVGLPGFVVELPVTTMVMMRSIADIARANGEDLASDDARRACLQVLALGGPDTDDDDVEAAYWSMRSALTHGTIATVISRVAAIFGATVSEKILAQAVPIAGALTGGGLNYLFMDYYQQMARVHFTLRALERAYGDPKAIRACFDHLVAQARSRSR